jgi:hypothetical protein
MSHACCAVPWPRTHLLDQHVIQRQLVWQLDGHDVAPDVWLVPPAPLASLLALAPGPAPALSLVLCGVRVLGHMCMGALAPAGVVRVKAVPTAPAGRAAGWVRGEGRLQQQRCRASSAGGAATISSVQMLMQRCGQSWGSLVSHHASGRGSVMSTSCIQGCRL